MSTAKGRRLTDQERITIVSDYVGGMTTGQVAAKYGIKPCSAWEFLKRRGVMRNPSEGHRKYTYNESVFDVMTPEAAYWIGFIAADGCVSRPKPGKGNDELIVMLKESDRQHLEALATFLGSNRPISKRVRKKDGLAYARLELRLTPGMSETLKSHGIVPRKSLCIEAPSHLAFSPDYWRGVIDGNGSLFLTPAWKGRMQRRVTLVSASEVFIEQYRSFLESIGVRTPKAHWGKGVWQIVSAHKDSLKVIKSLYGEGRVALYRKSEKAKLLLSVE